VELIRLLNKHRLEPKRMRLVHNCSDEPATMVLLEAVKGAGAWLDVEPPLILRNHDGQYTQEVSKFLGESL
jgi:tRNA1Val (adenine37-N6)-methyltransferase